MSFGPCPRCCCMWSSRTDREGTPALDDVTLGLQNWFRKSSCCTLRESFGSLFDDMVILQLTVMTAEGSVSDTTLNEHHLFEFESADISTLPDAIDVVKLSWQTVESSVVWHYILSLQESKLLQVFLDLSGMMVAHTFMMERTVTRWQNGSMRRALSVSLAVCWQVTSVSWSNN